MKNFIIAMMLILGFAGISNACENGVCEVQPRKVVTTTRTVVRNTVVRPVRRVYNACSGGVCRSKTVTTVR
jgi:hypothetical protein